MNLKPFVNDKYLYEDYLEVLSKDLEALHKKMEQTSDEKELFRLQGECRALRKLMKLRERVNNG